MTARKDARDVVDRDEETTPARHPCAKDERDRPTGFGVALHSDEASNPARVGLDDEADAPVQPVALCLRSVARPRAHVRCV